MHSGTEDSAAPRCLETDYLIIGAGAMGMAFADELIRRCPNDHIIMVDKRAKAGGHWNDAYPFVKLHQPAAYYGVNSESLGSGGEQLASGSEVVSYFDEVQQKLRGTGRLQVLPLCEYRGEDQDGAAQVCSLIADTQYKITVRKKLVDATYMAVEVPSTKPPDYPVADGACLITPNDLSKTRQPPAGHVVIGAGKTGMDAILFLVDCGVDPDSITWIKSNDAWLWDRSRLAPAKTIGWIVDLLEQFASADSLLDLMESNEQKHGFLRLDPDITPTKFRCATVSRQETETLRSIQNVVRLGRVQRIETDHIVLDGGEIPTSTRHVHVDCTADGAARRPAHTVFDGDRITLQSLFMCQQVFSAALTAYIESRDLTEDAKNSLCQAVPHPENAPDFIGAMAVSQANLTRWAFKIGPWLKRSRLSLSHHAPTFNLLLNGEKAKRTEAASLEAMRRIHAQECPETEFPI